MYSSSSFDAALQTRLTFQGFLGFTSACWAKYLSLSNVPFHFGFVQYLCDFFEQLYLSTVGTKSASLASFYIFTQMSKAGQKLS